MTTENGELEDTRLTAIFPDGRSFPIRALSISRQKRKDIPVLVTGRKELLCLPNSEIKIDGIKVSFTPEGIEFLKKYGVEIPEELHLPEGWTVEGDMPEIVSGDDNVIVESTPVSFDHIVVPDEEE